MDPISPLIVLPVLTGSLLIRDSLPVAAVQVTVAANARLLGWYVWLGFTRGKGHGVHWRAR